MLRYNRARRDEWVEAQKKLEADELATARLAYLKGEATEYQSSLVEEANREAEKQGVKLPPLLPPPEHRTHFEESFKHATEVAEAEKEKAQGKGILGFFTGKKGGDDASAGVVQAVEDKAKAAWEKEKENQRQGGSLDQVGLETTQPPKKKGWWPW